MGIKLTEDELNNILSKNPKIKINQEFGGKNSRVSLKESTNKIQKISLQDSTSNSNIQQDEPKKKYSNVDVKTINDINLKSHIQTSSSDIHFSAVFIGAKLLSVNQIFAILQYRKYEIFSYKKIWHQLIEKSLLQEKFSNNPNQTLPFFEDSVEITLFRQAKKLVDEDAMTTMFKYIIDGLKRDKKNPLGILKEDNPKIVHRISCYSEAGEPVIGIKIKKINTLKDKIQAKDLLIP